MRGRFAPSPSGPLHFGSLIAAVGSYLIAKTHNAEWQVRIEDIDPPREIAGATDTILRQLEAFGLHWDGPVIYQSEHIPRFQQILEELKTKGLLYACNCTRKQINKVSDNGRYPNICSGKNLGFDGEVAWKLRHGQGQYDFMDLIQGECQFPQDLYQEDFTVRRKDGLMAYQLAVVVDDIDAGIDHVVRGSDLLDSTPRQLRLYEVLSKEPPLWYHLPVAINQDGNKLSKQNHAEAVSEEKAGPLLVEALDFLGQQPPADLINQSIELIMDWALEHFSLQKIPQKQQIPYFD
ncbi:tRNA glutamyl-Q(34) synthetase GluQRS [Kangiella sediminilitoris]